MRHHGTRNLGTGSLGRWLVLGGALVLAPVLLSSAAFAKGDDDLDDVLGADLDSLTSDQIQKAIDEQRQGPPKQGTAPGQPPVQQQGPPRQQQQGPPREQGRPQGGTGAIEDPDLSDVIDAMHDGSRAVTDETQVRPTTPQDGAEIDRQVQQEVAPLANDIVQQQRNWNNLTPEQQQAELDRAKRSLREYADSVARDDVGMAEALRRVADGPESVASVDSRGYGAPISARRTYDANGETTLGGDGSGQMRWWEKLLATLVEGVAGGVKGYVATTRMNELKARADRLALRAGIENRPYADARVRQAVDAAGLSRMGYDKRLDDLLLGGNRTGGGTGALRPEPVTPVTDVGVARGPSRPVPRLPRVRDPITGAEKVVINMPLGADPVQPLSVRPR